MHVAARAEGLVAFAGQHHDRNILTLAADRERFSHLGDRHGREGVTHFRAVNRDLRDAFKEFEPDVGIFLDRFPGKSHLQFLKKMSCKKSEGEAELR